MYLIDTNIFLEILLDQENKDDCKEILEKVAEGEVNTTVSKFTVHGIEGMLTDDLESLEKFMTNITSLVNLSISETDIQEEKQILEIAKNSEMDFDDALQYMVAKRENLDGIISYDTDFDSTDLERVTPGEIVE
jgi:predicted nucleic acid-binding protein